MHVRWKFIRSTITPILRTNAAAAGTDMEGAIENILINDMKNTAVRNNGGGFYNHNLLECNDSNGGGLPTGDLLTAIALLNF
jgi:Fe-Mn family superoxide dismutase